MIKKNYNRIKEMLARAGKSSRDLASSMQVHEQTVSGWCTNENQPDIYRLFEIAEYLAVEAGELLTVKKNLITKKKESVSKKRSSKKA